MNKNDFIEKIKDLNDNIWSFGNEVLYEMAKDPRDLHEKKKVEGAIWLIGRAYAASPQRRSYNTKNNDIDYFNPEGKKPLKCPVWPVRTQNDGREGFFAEIANDLDVSCLKSFIQASSPRSYCFDAVVSCDATNQKNEYRCDLSENDKQLLVDSIVAVLSFNESLSRAIEKFDKVPSNSDIKCNNHISFASKFLHFYFPNAVFIVDTFAYNGGAGLFNGDTKVDLPVKNRHLRYIETPATENDYFENEIYQIPQFQKSLQKALTEDIQSDVNKKLNGLVNGRAVEQASAPPENDDKIAGSDYVAHCVRSYLMGLFLKNEGITPEAVVMATPSLCPMPRLIDTIFLNIKRELPEKEQNYQKQLERLYYNRQP